MLKSKLARLAHRISYTSGISGFFGRQQTGMRILMFHGVGGSDYPEDVFLTQMEFLQRHFSIVSLEQMVTALKQGERPSPPWVTLTFDDGLRNNYTVVYPILKRLGLPATFFVCPALLDSGQWLWNHEARERLRTLDDDRRAFLAQMLKAPGHGREEIVEWLKTLPIKPRVSAENLIRAMTPSFQPTPAQCQQFDIMSWQELERIAWDPSGLFTVGSHTMDHPILTGLLPGEIEFEVRESQKLLEQRLSQPIDYFCYPNGAYHQDVLTAVRRYYRGAVTTLPGIIGEASDLHQLPRIATAEQADQLAWRMSFAAYRAISHNEEGEYQPRSLPAPKSPGDRVPSENLPPATPGALSAAAE